MHLVYGPDYAENQPSPELIHEILEFAATLPNRQMIVAVT